MIFGIILLFKIGQPDFLIIFFYQYSVITQYFLFNVCYIILVFSRIQFSNWSKLLFLSLLVSVLIIRFIIVACDCHIFETHQSKTRKMSSSQGKHMPKDTQIIVSIMKDLGINDFDQQVLNHLLEFNYSNHIEIKLLNCFLV